MTDLAADTRHGADPDTPTRLGRWWVAVAVGMVLVIGTGVLARVTFATRDDERAVLQHERALSASTHRAEGAARARRDDAQQDAARLRIGLASPLALIAGLVDLSDQAVAASGDAQRHGLGTSLESVLAYNEAVARANVATDQFDGALRRLDAQLNALFGVDLPTV